jgi:hypothetical protein
MAFAFDPDAFLEEVAGHFATREERAEAVRFCFDANPEGDEPDAMVVLASVLLGGLNRVGQDPFDHVGLCLMRIAEELARRTLIASVA